MRCDSLIASTKVTGIVRLSGGKPALWHLRRCLFLRRTDRGCGMKPGFTGVAENNAARAFCRTRHRQGFAGASDSLGEHCRWMRRDLAGASYDTCAARKWIQIIFTRGADLWEPLGSRWSRPGTSARATPASDARLPFAFLRPPIAAQKLTMARDDGPHAAVPPRQSPAWLIESGATAARLPRARFSDRSRSSLRSPG